MPEPSVSTTELPAAEPAGTETAVPAGVETFILVAPPLEEDTTVEQSAPRKLGPFGWLAMGWLGLVAFMAILAPYLPLADPHKPFIESLSQGPSTGHLLGTDSIGEDLFSRVCWGARA